MAEIDDRLPAYRSLEGLGKLLKEYRKPPRRMSPQELERFRRKGWLKDPGPIARPSEAALDARICDGATMAYLRHSGCYMVCDLTHCRRAKRCMHRLPIGLRENKHWFLPFLAKLYGMPIPAHIAALEAEPLQVEKLRAEARSAFAAAPESAVIEPTDAETDGALPIGPRVRSV